MTSPRALEVVEAALVTRRAQFGATAPPYRVPSAWMSDDVEPRCVTVDPFAFHLDVVRRFKQQPIRVPSDDGGEWSREAVVYNMLVRTSAAFDHDGDGRLELATGVSQFRETGTFLKAIAMLPHIKRLGATVVHLLPITAIGRDGNKGSLGSPYAIRNPYQLDERLAEPILGLDAQTEFAAFVEAAHAIGLRVVLEFVLRTAARDADWIYEHPEWFYWVGADVPDRRFGDSDPSAYGPPIFTPDELHRIHADVGANRFHDLPRPDAQFLSLFSPPPTREYLAKEVGRYIGVSNGRRVRVSTAFSDWPPDDLQPPWEDVTYLRMYTNMEFDYVAYNTIRMYDSRLAAPAFVNRPLWDKIAGIIPYYQQTFRIDGVMIDMGHALPADLTKEVVQRAREIDPGFALWSEDFDVNHSSRNQGYNAVVGYLWSVAHEPQQLTNLCHRLASETLPIPFFAATENHNTPRTASRAGGTRYSQWTFAFSAFMPAIPFIHSGFELGETHPINTGMGFTDAELHQLSADRLPMFSEYAFDWARPTALTRFVAQVMAVRARYLALVTDPEHSTFRVLATNDPEVRAYARVRPGQRLGVVTNTDVNRARTVDVRVPHHGTVTDFLSSTSFEVANGVLSTTLEPGQALVFEF
ncbi:MAG: hypothetical protein SFX73_15725 [Kofleriaceae bacterium]|nr:hypothetical protein [Kofleriaceae bacterium]